MTPLKCRNPYLSFPSHHSQERRFGIARFSLAFQGRQSRVRRLHNDFSTDRFKIAMAQTKIDCPDCNNPLKFRRWSDRKPAKSEALADCLQCGTKWQIRFWHGQQTSEPYQVRKTEKPCRVSGRLSENRKAEIVAIWGSVQNYLDHSVIQIGMTQQYKS